MAALAEKRAKTERIEVRVPARAKALLTAAAQIRHTSVSEFLLTQGVQAAEQVIAVPHVFYASEEGWSAIQRLLDEEDDVQPTAETIAWLTEKRRRAA
jgi:uncharacterized protein (DUF1778 family)